MSDNLFAVVEHQQWRGPYEGNVSFRASLTEATELADELTASSRSDSGAGRFRVYRMDEVDESELYDWAFRSSDGLISVGPFESQVRACCPAGHTVVKRRLGTTDWVPVPEEER